MTGLAPAPAGAAVWPRAVEAPGPASFAERGVAILCTTPGLDLARLRGDGRGHLEIVLPNLVGGRGVYVVPWGAVPEIMIPTVHDRMLHHEIVRRAALDPESLRLARLRLAARGFAGADAAEPAQRALAGDERIATATNLALIIRLIHEGGLSAAEARLAASRGRAGEFKRALDAVAARTGIAAAELVDRSAALSVALASVGLAEPHPPGRQRRVLARLEALAASLADWAQGDDGDEGEIARHCSAVAEDAARRCRAIVAAIDRRVGALVPVLRAWPRDRRLFDDSRLRLAWLLDGWQRAIVVWQEACAAPRLIQTTALGRIFRALPLVPGEADDLAQAQRRLMRRHAELFTDWEAGSAAAEVTRRLERASLHADIL
jgi:hypothetical protein